LKKEYKKKGQALAAMVSQALESDKHVRPTFYYIFNGKTVILLYFKK
jgi:hypothetical protein